MTADMWFAVWVIFLGVMLSWVIGEWGRIRQERSDRDGGMA